MSVHVKPFVIVDTREQLPYTFPGWPTIRATLKTGDISILGHEECFVIERKSLNDLAGCIFKPRFRAELERLKSYKHAFLAIEANIYKIENMMPRFSQVNPVAMLGFLQSIPLQYGVHVLLLDDRARAEVFVRGLLEKYNRYLLKEKE